MTLTINDTAPDFEAQTTEGKIRFHDWIGDKWAVLFSAIADFAKILEGTAKASARREELSNGPGFALATTSHFGGAPAATAGAIFC